MTVNLAPGTPQHVLTNEYGTTEIATLAVGKFMTTRKSGDRVEIVLVDPALDVYYVEGHGTDSRKIERPAIFYATPEDARSIARRLLQVADEIERTTSPNPG